MGIHDMFFGTNPLPFNKSFTSSDLRHQENIKKDNFNSQLNTCINHYLKQIIKNLT